MECHVTRKADSDASAQQGVKDIGSRTRRARAPSASLSKARVRERVQRTIQEEHWQPQFGDPAATATRSVTARSEDQRRELSRASPARTMSTHNRVSPRCPAHSLATRAQVHVAD